MSRAGLGSALVFLAFAAGGLLLFFHIHAAILGRLAFLALGLIGCAISARLFDRLATREEKRRDLEDRVRNPDL